MLMFFGIIGIISLWLVPFVVLIQFAVKVDKESEFGSNVIAGTAFVWLVCYLIFMIYLAGSV